MIETKVFAMTTSTHAKGRSRFDKFVRFYPFAELNRAVDDQRNGHAAGQSGRRCDRESAAMQGVLHGAQVVRRLALDARHLYQHQAFQFTGDYGDNGFLEEYTSEIQGEPTRVVVMVYTGRAVPRRGVTTELHLAACKAAASRRNQTRHDFVAFFV